MAPPGPPNRAGPLVPERVREDIDHDRIHGGDLQIVPNEHGNRNIDVHVAVMFQVKLDFKFAAFFPQEIRDTVERIFHDELVRQQNPPADQSQKGYVYTINGGKIIRSFRPAHYFRAYGYSEDVENANVKLLNLIMREEPEMVPVFRRRNFIRMEQGLASQKANPDILQHHALRYGDAGWNVDKHHGLAILYPKPEREGHTLRAYFVERVEVNQPENEVADRAEGEETEVKEDDMDVEQG
ncbi:hypothetical protein BU26DRAFT_570643 [Trematosphaeria pertusa]|uniref:Uncharacterized protein n=1 Tax=Trematosphaeria pertusa TaxID=390896 RepID=A0A6A6HX03_9PLEO|nr:uncharacterized protein BU26DRAFT_570643 [Trematosphaeria pertusa]KAF2242567.1 hypothetical protein BU26DRAFT_570643 [Trematosphaeria pertusa]